MNLIYSGNYFNRFKNIFKIIDDKKSKSLLELCFGDTIIADYCGKNNIFWKGLDLNQKFVDYAKAKGHDAVCKDVLFADSFNKVDICIICGSFYHFNNDQRIQLLKKMFSASDTIIISEPIVNLSANKGIIGYIAKHSANAGKGNESFRFDKQSFITMLEETKQLFNFSYTISGFINKDIIVLLEKNGSN